MSLATRTGSTASGSRTSPVRRITLLSAITLLLAGAFTMSLGAQPEPAFAATVAINQCNYDETGAAREIRCDVTVVNNLDVATGVTSSTVTTTVCAGPPGEALTTCATTPGAPSVDIIGSVNQCNNSVNAGGSTVICNVSVINNITGVGDTSPTTVNQCIGSGTGGGSTVTCAPVESTTNADVDQCNRSANGGGSFVTCNVNTSTTSALWPVTILQCNDSANGNGDTVTCTAQITTNLLAPVPVTTNPDTTVAPGTSVVGITTPAPTVPVTPPRELPKSGSTSTGVVLAAGLALAAGVLTVFAVRRRRPA